MARIDRLEEKLKEVLYGASVIGREFDKPLLKEILKKKETIDPSLAELLTLELILEKEEAKELAYLFKHYLIQEVAYNTILQKKRKELHKLIAQAIEKVYAEKLKDFYELLSFHYEKAEEWEKAADYLNRSGNKAREMFSKEESKRFYERKEEAKVKLLESKSTKNKMVIFFRIVFIVCLLVSITFAILSSYYFIKKDPHLASVPPAVFVLSLSFSVIFCFFIFGLLYQALRIRPMLFELFDDRIHCTFDNGYSFSLLYSEILYVYYYQKPKINLKWKNITKQFYVPPESLKSEFALIHETITPYVHGFGSKKGEIHIRKKEGVQYGTKASILTPWKIGYERERDVSITANEPKEFHEQLLVALSKWKSSHESAPLQNFHPPHPSGEPLIVIQPKPGLFSVLCSLNRYGVFFLFYILFFIVVTTLYIIDHGISLSLTGTVSALIGLCVYLCWIIDLRMQQKNNRYEFYNDRINFREVHSNPREGSLFYDSIVKIEEVSGLFRKIFGMGDLMIRTNRIIRTNSNSGFAISGMVIPDIKDSHKALEEIQKIIEAYRVTNSI
jgi:membrane protein YdbS with pleckstrin-like domain